MTKKNFEKIQKESNLVAVLESNGEATKEPDESQKCLRRAMCTAIRAGATPRHVPAAIIAVPDIPRTRSGKITELAVRDIIHGRAIKNTEALANAKALTFFKNLPELR